jgi:Protein of unknown function (DUF3300)
MRTPTRSIHERARAWLATLLAIASLAVVHGNAAAQSQRAYTQPELDQMVAPIALYPDPLLSQILMASTYPIEVVEAARWSRANPGLQGDAAVRTVEGMDWDPSVKSLVAFPDVLVRMDENLEWTRQLGDAFLVQEPQVMETVQRLRQQARAAGTLATDARVRVVDDGPIIVVQPVDPRVIYVPYYDPRVAYGTWWWPTYPPVFWAPWPGYAVHYARPGIATGFFWGPAVHVSVGFFFGVADWPHRQVRVVSVNNYYYRPAVRRDVHVTQINAVPGPWRHDPWHRRGVTYRTPEVQQRFAPAAPPREVNRTPSRQPEAVQSRPEPRAQAARPVTVSPVPAAQAERGVAHRDERVETHGSVQPQQNRRVEPRQPGVPASHPATPATAPRPRTSVAPASRSEPTREHAQDRAHPANAVQNGPRPASPGATPNAREAGRGNTRDAASHYQITAPQEAAAHQDQRTGARGPAAREQTERGAESNRAPGQPQPSGAQLQQPRVPGKDVRP